MLELMTATSTLLITSPQGPAALASSFPLKEAPLPYGSPLPLSTSASPFAWAWCALPAFWATGHAALPPPFPPLPCPAGPVYIFSAQGKAPLLQKHLFGPGLGQLTLLVPPSVCVHSERSAVRVVGTYHLCH